MDLPTIFRVTAIKEERLMEACRSGSDNPNLEVEDVGYTVFSSAVMEILACQAEENDCPDLAGACQVVLEDSRGVIEELLKEIRLHSQGNASTYRWGLLSKLAGRALRGELSSDFFHTPQPDAIERMKHYLTPDSYRMLRVDALTQQRSLLGLDT